MSESDRGDRPRAKKSWRDVDSQRDKSRSSTPSDRPSHSLESERASKQYRATLDALFEKGELGKFAEKLSSTARSAPAAAPAPTGPPAEPAPAAAKPNPEIEARAILRKKILTALGREEISRSVDRYVKAHGMPADFEILEQALEHTKPERVGEALAALEALLAREKPKRSRTLASKLRFIEETSSDPELVERSTQVRAKLGSI